MNNVARAYSDTSQNVQQYVSELQHDLTSENPDGSEEESAQKQQHSSLGPNDKYWRALVKRSLHQSRELSNELWRNLNDMPPRFAHRKP